MIIFRINRAHVSCFYFGVATAFNTKRCQPARLKTCEVLLPAYAKFVWVLNNYRWFSNITNHDTINGFGMQCLVSSCAFDIVDEIDVRLLSFCMIKGSVAKSSVDSQQNKQHQFILVLYRWITVYVSDFILNFQSIHYHSAIQ